MRKGHGRKKKKASDIGDSLCQPRPGRRKYSWSGRLGREPGREERPHRMGLVSRGIPGCQGMLEILRPKQVCRERAPVSF